MLLGARENSNQPAVTSGDFAFWLARVFLRQDPTTSGGHDVPVANSGYELALCHCALGTEPGSIDKLSTGWAHQIAATCADHCQGLVVNLTFHDHILVA